MRLCVALAMGLIFLPLGSWAAITRVEHTPVEGFEPEPSFVNSIGMTMVLIPAGSFMMGSTRDDRYRHYGELWGGDESPAHLVRLSSFYMSAHEVTIGQYSQYLEDIGVDSPFPEAPEFWEQMLETPDRPMFYVSWHEARAFYHWLNEREADTIPEGGQYRFPTEAEWEHCCRAGTTTAFNVGDTLGMDQAYFNRSAPSGHVVAPTEVGSYPPNAWGLYDMHGNVAEWCMDEYYEGFYSEPEATQGNPFSLMGHRSSRWLKGPNVRGGGASSSTGGLRSAIRGREDKDERSSTLGFRLIMIDPRLPPLPDVGTPVLDTLEAEVHELERVTEPVIEINPSDILNRPGRTPTGPPVVDPRRRQTQPQRETAPRDQMIPREGQLQIQPEIQRGLQRGAPIAPQPEDVQPRDPRSSREGRP